MYTRRKYWLILFFYIPAMALAQHQNPLKSLRYHITYTSNGEKLVDDVCQLDIYKDRSYFYSLGLLDQLDLLEKKTEIARKANTLLSYERDEFKRDVYLFNTLKSYSEDRAIVIQNIDGQWLGYIKDNLKEVRWEILKETKIISGYLCHKAERSKDNSRITVWFTTQIPLHEGPFFYYGLPGLIVRSSSSLGWQAEMVSISHGEEKVRSKCPPFNLVSELKVAKAKRNEINNKRNLQLERTNH